jgi:hypothetical protein
MTHSTITSNDIFKGMAHYRTHYQNSQQNWRLSMEISKTKIETEFGYRMYLVLVGSGMVIPSLERIRKVHK